MTNIPTPPPKLFLWQLWNTDGCVDGYVTICRIMLQNIWEQFQDKWACVKGALDCLSQADNGENVALVVV